MNDQSQSVHQQRTVALWLLVCCALVFAMVVLGGVTRLTGSGLSMVEWKPISGVLPPLNDADWQTTFAKYQQSPEFHEVNAEMGVQEFKRIFWLEYLHRLLGRVIGIVFLLPFLVFVTKGYIQRKEWPKYILMFTLGGLQGLLGWYMVKSGLVDAPQVSQYRLTSHLVAAFLIYAYMFWVALSLLFPKQTPERHAWFGKAVALSTVISVTIISGAFVAGLKAGKIFNTFPMMGDYWVPPGVLALQPGWKNFFDNPTTAQLDHRVLATATLLVVVAFWFGFRKLQRPARARNAANFMLVAIVLQVSLGILTLLYHVPIVLAASHQAVALLLFTAALYLVHCLRDEPQQAG